MSNIIFYNANLVDSSINCQGALLVLDEKIFSVLQGDFSTQEKAMCLESLFPNDTNIELVDCNAKTLMPSFIDMHVHFRYPGQTEKEDLQSGLNAAVAGGFGTVVLMPNTKPIISTDEMAHSIEKEASSYALADVIQTVSITKDFEGKDTSHIDNLEKIPVITEDGHDVSSSLVLYDAMCKCAVKGIIVDCHCEDDSFTETAKKFRQKALALINEPNDNKTTDEIELKNLQIEASFQEANKYLALAEDVATIRNIQLAKDAGCHLHVSHVSTANCIRAIKEAKEDEAYSTNGFSITCEVTPHHFGLSSDDNENLSYIVNPPIRSEIDRQALLNAFSDNTVDVISTDHAPHTYQDKKNGAPGFPGLETAFSVASTELLQTGIISINKLSELMSANPAKILELDNIDSSENARGKLLPQMLANLVLVDLNEQWTVDSSLFKTKGSMSPFEGHELTGKVISTWYKGIKVY